MDKLPVTPSPHRFLLKSRNTPVPHPAACCQPRSQQSGHEISASRTLDTPSTGAALELASPGNSRRGVDDRTQHQTRDLRPQAASTSPVDAEDTKLCTHNVLKTPNAGTGDGAGFVQVREYATGSKMRRSTNTPAQGQIAKVSTLSSQREPTKPTNGMSRVPAEQMRAPTMSQFKAAPKFRFGSSQSRAQSGSGVTRERANTEIKSNVTPRLPQGRLMATQTPLRQSLRREPTEEEIVDAEENEMLMEGVRQSIERQDIDGEDDEHGQKSYIELDFATSAAKRRKVSADAVETLPSSQSQHHDDLSNGHDVLHGREHEGHGRKKCHNEGYEDDHEEMPHSGDHVEHEQQLLFDRKMPPTSQPIHSHPQPATPAPTYYQRPRFLLPSSIRRPLARPSTPQTPHQLHETFAPTPHFILHTPAPAQTPADDEPQFIRPPKFRPVEEPEPSEPLPAEFSPRKRGQKFVIGGLANEVRSWLVDLETRSSASSTGQQKDDEGWVVKMLVEEAGGGRNVGWTLAKGMLEGGEGLSMILGGEGMMEGLEKRKEVQRESVVAIRAPVWEVEVQGERWSVGANWKTWDRGG